MAHAFFESPEFKSFLRDPYLNLHSKDVKSALRGLDVASWEQIERELTGIPTEVCSQAAKNIIGSIICDIKNPEQAMAGLSLPR